MCDFGMPSPTFTSAPGTINEREGDFRESSKSSRTLQMCPGASPHCRSPRRIRSKFSSAAQPFRAQARLRSGPAGRPHYPPTTNFLRSRVVSLDIEGLLGDQASHLLDHKCETIGQELLTLPGPEFVTDVVSGTDRSAQVMRLSLIHI